MRPLRRKPAARPLRARFRAGRAVDRPGMPRPGREGQRPGGRGRPGRPDARL